MSAAVIIQARMSSSRLPGKVMLPLGDRTVLAWCVERARLSPAVDDVIVATSTCSEDEVIEKHAASLGVPCVRGSLIDALDRYRLALTHTDADTIVRITADCPFVDTGIITSAIGTVDSPERPDYASTGQDGRYALGLDVEAMTRSALLIAAESATATDERECVTLFIYRRPKQFALAAVAAPAWARRPDLRFTLDEPADYEVISAVVEGLNATPDALPASEVIAFLDRHPEIAALNKSVHHRTVK